MGFEKAGDILREAKRTGRAVAAFNVFNYETIRWAVQSAEETGLPVLIGFYPGWKNFIPLRVVADITRTLSQHLKTPIGLHLDHCSSFEGIKEALDAGFPSVMFDGSLFPFEENVSRTREAVELADRYGADVEGELGHVGNAGNLSDFKDRNHFTDAVAAERFVAETGVSSLAISIGNAHGDYICLPELDIALLTEINRRLAIPLVLHGGSGIPGDQVCLAVRNGISKMNVATDYMNAYYHSVEKIMHDGLCDDHMYFCIEKSMPEIIDFLKAKILLLNG